MSRKMHKICIFAKNEKNREQQGNAWTITLANRILKGVWL